MVVNTPMSFVALCCARAASGHAAAPPSRVMNVRRLMWSPQSWELPYHIIGAMPHCALQQLRSPHFRFGSFASEGCTAEPRFMSAWPLIAIEGLRRGELTRCATSNCVVAGRRSRVEWVASRLALCAPALRAATALTRPPRRAVRLPCDRHDVPTGGTVGPMHVLANHGVERNDHFAHDRYDHDFWRLACRFETVTECFEHRIVLAGTQSSHVEHIPDGCAATPDAPHAFELAAVEVIRSNADQGCDTRAVKPTELGQQGDQRAGQHRPDTWHRGEQAIAMSELGIGCDDLDHTLVELLDVSSEPGDAAAGKALQHPIFLKPRDVGTLDLKSENSSFAKLLPLGAAVEKRKLRMQPGKSRRRTIRSTSSCLIDDRM